MKGKRPALSVEAIAYRRDSVAKWHRDFPELDLVQVAQDLLLQTKTSYLATHDGHRATRGKGAGGVTIRGLAGLAHAVSDLLGMVATPVDPLKPKLGIALIHRGIQDAGKNLIAGLWRTLGYEVLDLGVNVKPAVLFRALMAAKVEVLGISCMSHEGLQGLEQFAQIMVGQGLGIPLVVGGIAINQRRVAEIVAKSGLTMVYGRDVRDAETVLNRALAGQTQTAGFCIQGDTLALPAHLESLTKRWGFSVLKIPVEKIVVDTSARDGCACCPPEKRDKCPLVLGYEKVVPLDEARQFLHGFSTAVLVSAGIPADDSESHGIWMGLLELERWLAQDVPECLSFRFPIPCPFCSVKNCTLSQGKCVNENLYRPVHETYQIDIPATVKAVLGEDELAEMYALVCLR